MTKNEAYAIAVDNYYHDVQVYTDVFKRGDIDRERFESLVSYAREFWLSENNQ